MKRNYRVFADYFQFYLWDGEIRPFPPTDYTDTDVERRVKTDSHLVVVLPARNMEVPVEFEVLDRESDPEIEKWDHVAEASLDLPSGKLEIHECTGGSIATVTVKPGVYRVRACFGSLNDISENGLYGNDHYRIEIWPAPFAPITVAKQFSYGKVSPKEN